MSQTETPHLQNALARLSQTLNDSHLLERDTENDTVVAEDTAEEQSICSSGNLKDCIKEELRLIDF